MGTLASMNQAVNGTAISSTEYNDNMNRIRSSVNSVDTAQLATSAVTNTKIADSTIESTKLKAGTLANAITDADADTSINLETTTDDDIITFNNAGVETFKLSELGILTLPKQSCTCLTKSSTQSFGSGSWTKITFDGTKFDQQSEFADATDRWVCTEAGKYLLIGMVGISSSDTAEVTRGAIYKDDSAVSVVTSTGNSIGNEMCVVAFESFAVDEYAELFGYYSSSSRSFTTNCKLIVIKVA